MTKRAQRRRQRNVERRDRSDDDNRTSLNERKDMVQDARQELGRDSHASVGRERAHQDAESPEAVDVVYFPVRSPSQLGHVLAGATRRPTTPKKRHRTEFPRTEIAQPSLIHTPPQAMASMPYQAYRSRSTSPRQLQSRQLSPTCASQQSASSVPHDAHIPSLPASWVSQQNDARSMPPLEVMSQPLSQRLISTQQPPLLSPLLPSPLLPSPLMPLPLLPSSPLALATVAIAPVALPPVASVFCERDVDTDRLGSGPVPIIPRPVISTSLGTVATDDDDDYFGLRSDILSQMPRFANVLELLTS